MSESQPTETDRKLLDKLGFIRPAGKSSPRSQVPVEFLDTVPSHAAWAVYLLLRSKPPSHRWKGSEVHREMKKAGMGQGTAKKALSALNKAGWIRYVKLLDKNRTSKGSIIEVMYRKLVGGDTKANKRFIRFDGRGDFGIFDGNGKPISPDDYQPIFLIDESAAEGGEDGKPLVRHPNERKPNERIASQKYQEHPIEDPPINPPLEKGDDVFFPGVEDSETGTDYSQPHDGFPGMGDDTLTTFTVDSDVVELERQLLDLGSRSIHGPEARRQYECLVAEKILPGLEEPPPRSRWPVAEAVAWCQSSLKGRVLLAMTSDSSWPPNLARKFVKRHGTYGPSFFKHLLLGFRWERPPRYSLAEVFEVGGAKVKGSPSPRNWRTFTSELNDGYNEVRQRLAYDAQNLRQTEGVTEAGHAELWIAQTMKSALMIPRYDSTAPEKFIWLFRGGFWELQGGDLEDFPGLEINRRAWAEEMVDLVSGVWIFLVIAAAFKRNAFAFWGFEWSRARKHHEERVAELNERLELYELIKVQPHFYLFDKWELNWRELRE